MNISKLRFFLWRKKITCGVNISTVRSFAFFSQYGVNIAGMVEKKSSVNGHWENLVSMDLY